MSFPGSLFVLYPHVAFHVAVYVYGHRAISRCRLVDGWGSWCWIRLLQLWLRFLSVWSADQTPFYSSSLRIRWAGMP